MWKQSTSFSNCQIFAQISRKQLSNSYKKAKKFTVEWPERLNFLQWHEFSPGARETVSVVSNFVKHVNAPHQRFCCQKRGNIVYLVPQFSQKKMKHWPRQNTFLLAPIYVQITCWTPSRNKQGKMSLFYRGKLNISMGDLSEIYIVNVVHETTYAKY